MRLGAGLWKAFAANDSPLARIAPGERVYAIGDVHGRLDLFANLIERIADDDARRPVAQGTLVILGDFVDRGPFSARMIAVLRECGELGERVVVLKGNHEEMMSEALRGRPLALRGWLANGGGATLASFGIAGEIVARAHPAELLEAAHACIPAEVRAWLDALPLAFRMGDYLFVHAGIRPGVPLDAQNPRDLLWIRQPFLKSKADHGAVIVHGHSIQTDPVLGGNHIGVDTGAYRTGVLTAVGLEGDEAWLVDTAS